MTPISRALAIVLASLLLTVPSSPAASYDLAGALDAWERGSDAWSWLGALTPLPGGASVGTRVRFDPRLAAEVVIETADGERLGPITVGWGRVVRFSVAGRKIRARLGDIQLPWIEAAPATSPPGSEEERVLEWHSRGWLGQESLRMDHPQIARARVTTQGPPLASRLEIQVRGEPRPHTFEFPMGEQLWELQLQDERIQIWGHGWSQPAATLILESDRAPDRPRRGE